MNERSILSSLAGSVARYSIDALPVPKSSIDTPTPPARSASSAAIAALGIDQRGALGDLHREPLAAGWRGARSSSATCSGSSGSSRLRADRLTDISEVDAAPRQRDHLRERLLDHVQRERPDERGRLDLRDELVRAEQAALGVLPAHERLHAGDTPALQVDLRLVVEDELAALERPSDLAEQDQAVRVEVVARGRVHVDPARVRARAGERRVGALQQQLGPVGVLVHDRDADARLDVQRDAVDHDRRLEARLHGGGAAARALLAVRVRGTGSRTRRRRGARAAAFAGERRAQAPRDLAQHAVAVCVAERVVDLGEAIDVDQQDRDAAWPRRFAAHRLRDTPR